MLEAEHGQRQQKEPPDAWTSAGREVARGILLATEPVV